jgi:phage shock protein A
VNLKLTLTQNELASKTEDLNFRTEQLQDRDEHIKERNKKVDELLAEGRKASEKIFDLGVEKGDLENKLATKQAEITDLTNALESEVQESKEKDIKLADYQEKYRLKIEEYNELKDKLIPKWFQNITYWVGVENASEI